MFGSLEFNQSTQIQWVGQHHLFSPKWSFCNSYNTKFYCHLYKSRGIASIFAMHTLAPRKLLELRYLLSSLVDFYHRHHHQHLYFIGLDISVVAKGCLHLRFRLLLSSPTFIANLLFRLHGWPTMQTLLSVFVITIGCYTAIDWITGIVIFINILSSLFNIAHSTAIDRQLRLHSRLSLLPSVINTASCVCCYQLLSCFAWLMDFAITIDERLRLHHRLTYYASTDGHLHLLHQSPCLLSTDYIVAMAAQLCRRCWAPSSSLLADLTVADWFLRLHGNVTSSPLIGVIVFTTTNIIVSFDGWYHLCRQVVPRLGYLDSLGIVGTRVYARLR